MGVHYHNTDSVDSVDRVRNKNIEAANETMLEVGADTWDEWELAGFENEGAFVLLEAEYTGEIDLTCNDEYTMPKTAHYSGMMKSGEVVKVSNDAVTVKTQSRY